MAETKEYTVNRAMQSGSESFERGDTRKLTEADAAGLVESGALTLKGSKTAEREPAVVHTFGTVPSEVESYTDASTGKEASVSVQDKRPAAAPKSRKA